MLFLDVNKLSVKYLEYFASQKTQNAIDTIDISDLNQDISCRAVLFVMLYVFQLAWC